MGRNLSQSRQPGLLKYEEAHPHIRYNKDTEEWNRKKDILFKHMTEKN